MFGSSMVQQLLLPSLIFQALLTAHHQILQRKSVVAIKLGSLSPGSMVTVQHCFMTSFHSPSIKTSANLSKASASFISTVFPDLICKLHICSSQNFVRILKLCTASAGQIVFTLFLILSTLSHTFLMNLYTLVHLMLQHNGQWSVQLVTSLHRLGSLQRHMPICHYKLYSVHKSMPLHLSSQILILIIINPTPFHMDPET